MQRSRNEAAEPGILLVSSVNDDLISLLRILGETAWPIHWFTTCGEALDCLKEKPIALIVSERRVADGNWRRLLEAVATMHNPPPLIVASRLADERLWAEVLSLGGYDVLMAPFDAEEVLITLRRAYEQWRSQHSRASAA